MELHPLEGVHSWKQFLIHLVIVVVGIVVAIGLEQAVEWVHHRQQRREFETELRAEGLSNQKIVESEVRWLDVQIGWLLDAKSYVDSYRLSHGKTGGGFPLHPPDDMQKGSVGDVDPLMAVWTRGKENSLVALLPREQAEGYGTMYAVAELEIEQDRASLKQMAECVALMAGDRQHPVTLDLSDMSDAQLEALSLALGRAYVSWDVQRRFLVLFYGENQAMLNGTTSREAFNEQIAEAFHRFPDRYNAFRLR